VWEVPYLPIDPADIGRTYEAVIRINSQSGKGGAAWVLEQAHGFALPKAMHPEFGAVVQRASEAAGGELPAAAIRELLEREYLARTRPLELVRWRLADGPVESTGVAPAQVVAAAHGMARRSRSASRQRPDRRFLPALRRSGLATFRR
jgi:2-isopropylmalate synthase